MKRHLFMAAGALLYINSKGVELKTTSSGGYLITNGANGLKSGTSNADVFHSVANSTLSGGLGNDVYYLWDNSSKIIEAADGGSDTVYVKAWNGFQLPSHVENLVLDSPAGTWGTGNGLDNLIIAGAARATLDGGRGADVLVGGAGADVFKITATNGSDVIYNFKPGWDTVKLAGYSFTSFDQLKAAASQTGADVIVQLSSTESLTLRNVQLESLGAADFGLPLTKAAIPAGSTVLSAVNQAVNANGWYAVTNAWGAAGLVANVDYKVDASFRKADMTKGTTFNWSFAVNTDYTPTIKAYPEVIFGISPLNSVRTNPTDTKMVFPAKVGDLVSLTAAYDVSYAGNTGGFNVAYDIWLTSKPYGDKSTVTNEIMVWVKKGDFEAFGTQVGTYTKGDFTAKIYHTGTYTAIVSDKDVPAGVIDVADILNKLKTLGYVSDSEYVASVELGAEVTGGSGSLTINDLDLVVATKTASGGVLTKTVGGNGATVAETAAPAPPPVVAPPPAESVVVAPPAESVEAAPPPPPAPPPATVTPSASVLAYFKAGTEKLVDAHGVVLGSKVTAITDLTATVTKTDVVGKSLGYDSITLDANTASVKHYDGAGRLAGVDALTFAADGSVTTKHFNPAGAVVDAVKEYTTAAGVAVVERYNSAMALTGVDKTTVSNGVQTIQHFNGSNQFLGYETISKAADGMITVRYSNAYWALTAIDTIKTVNGVTTTSHFDGKGPFLGADVSSIDVNGVTKTLFYDSSFKTANATSFTGTDRADTLAGSSGATHFHGGLGSDRIAGGAGVDYFHFDTAIGQGDVDVISGFSAANDRIVLDRSVFTAFTGAGAIDAATFVAGTAALDGNDRILFDKATGSVWYDDDGVGAHNPVLLATLGGGVDLTAANFLVA